MNALVNGSLIEYKWFQPHFTANLFHLSLLFSLSLRMLIEEHRHGEGMTTTKKSNFASSSHDTDNYRYEHLKQLIQNNPQTWHNIVCPYVENTITITEWFICKYVNGNWFAYVEENAKFGQKGFWIPSETESMNQTPNLHHKRVRN